MSLNTFESILAKAGDGLETPTPMESKTRESYSRGGTIYPAPDSDGNVDDSQQKLGWVSGSDMDLAAEGRCPKRASK